MKNPLQGWKAAGWEDGHEAQDRRPPQGLGPEPIAAYNEGWADGAQALIEEWKEAA